MKTMPDAIEPRYAAFFHETLSTMAEIPERDWAEAIVRFRQVSIPKDGFFLRPGEKPDKLAFIASGLFRVFFPTAGGEERILVFREEGRLLSGYNSSQPSRESWFGIQALEDSVILRADIDEGLLADWADCWRA